MSLKRVLVTGGAKRLGRASVLELANHGWNVVIHCNASREEADALAATLNAKAAGSASVVQADLSRESETQALIARAGPLTALVNNASLFEYDDWKSVTRATWDRHLETNLRAPFVLMQNFARALPDGEEGAIVNIVDQAVLQLTPEFTSYMVAKAGLWTLTQTMAQALAPRIRVNAVGPGPSLKASKQSEQNFQAQIDATLLKRPSRPEDIAGAVRYLLEARAVTGQMIAADAGQHLARHAPVVDGGHG